MYFWINFLDYHQSFIQRFYNINVYNLISCHWHFHIQEKKLQSLHLILWIPAAQLSTKFDIELAINQALSINLFCKILLQYFYCHLYQFLILFFLWNRKSFVLFSIFSKTFKLSFKFFLYFFNSKMIIIIWTIIKKYRKFMGTLNPNVNILFTSIIAMSYDFYILQKLSRFFATNLTFSAILMWFEFFFVNCNSFCFLKLFPSVFS